MVTDLVISHSFRSRGRSFGIWSDLEVFVTGPVVDVPDTLLTLLYNLQLTWAIGGGLDFRRRGCLWTPSKPPYTSLWNCVPATENLDSGRTAVRQGRKTHSLELQPILHRSSSKTSTPFSSLLSSAPTRCRSPVPDVPVGESWLEPVVSWCPSCVPPVRYWTLLLGFYDPRLPSNRLLGLVCIHTIIVCLGKVSIIGVPYRYWIFLSSSRTHCRQIRWQFYNTMSK